VQYHCILMLGISCFIEDQLSKAVLKLAEELEHGNTSSEEPDPTMKECSLDLPDETNAEENDCKALA